MHILRSTTLCEIYTFQPNLDNVSLSTRRRVLYTIPSGVYSAFPP